jgi:aminoglycoside phosphotransferase (APT) family kinase protein
MGPRRNRASSAPRLGAGREAEILAWGDHLVLRWLHDPEGRDRLEIEAAAMTVAAEGGVPVPTVYDVIMVDGRPGLIMDRIDGEDLLTVLERQPWTFARAASRLGRLQAQLHDISAPPVLPDLRRTLLDRIDAAPHLPPHLAAYARDLLAELPDGDRICHGDFHPGNVIAHADGEVLIDWSNAARGDPMGDLARTMLLVRIGALPADTPRFTRAVTQFGRKLLLRAWLGSYRRVRTFDPSVIRRWETVGAAARLSEGIDEEVGPLLRLLKQRHRRGVVTGR